MVNGRFTGSDQQENPGRTTASDEKHVKWRKFLDVWLQERKFNLKHIWFQSDIWTTPYTSSRNSRDYLNAFSMT